MATTIRARIYARGEVSFVKFIFLPVGLPNYWRSIFLVLPKLYGCQVDLPNCWSCSKDPLKDRKGDQRGGSEWEPIKFLLQRENSAYTPIATRFTRTHKSGSKLVTHKPTRPREKPRIKLEGLEAEANHKRRSNKMSAWAGADSPHSRGRPSTVLWRTVCTALANRPKKPPEPPVAHHEKRTVHRLPADRSPRADRPPNLVHQKSTDKMDRMEDTKELTTNTKNTWLKVFSQTVRTGLADCPPGARTAARAWHFEVQPYLPFTWSLESTNLNQPRESYQIIRKGGAPLGDAIPTNLEPKIHWVERNQDSTELNQKASVPTEIHNSEAKSGIWRIKIKHKDAQDIYLWFPQRKPNTNTSESTNRATHKNPQKIPPKIA
jgi:hypothetical protein